MMGRSIPSNQAKRRTREKRGEREREPSRSSCHQSRLPSGGGSSHRSRLALARSLAFLSPPPPLLVALAPRPPFGPTDTHNFPMGNATQVGAPRSFWSFPTRNSQRSTEHSTSSYVRRWKYRPLIFRPSLALSRCPSQIAPRTRCSAVADRYAG
ncbi:hypothetical protein IWZ01DRAFT_318576 [Phyllosticta capitalensis]